MTDFISSSLPFSFREESLLREEIGWSLFGGLKVLSLDARVAKVRRRAL